MSSSLRFELKKQAEQVPSKPGVYLHYDEHKSLLYVGKSKNLKKRLLSYFTSFEQLSLKVKSLVSKIHFFEVLLTDTEAQALILENQLIKEHQPTYNTLLRDDKTYPYLKLDLSREWPDVSLVRSRNKAKALYFGPYPKPKQAHLLLDLIQSQTKLVRCSPQTFRRVSRPCFYFDVGQCDAPCHLEVSREVYEKDVRFVKDLLGGQNPKIEKQLWVKMKDLAAKECYEEAARVRDQIFLLRDWFSDQSWDLPDEVSFFLWSSLSLQDQVFCYLTEIREGRLIGCRLIWGSDHGLLLEEGKSFFHVVTQLLMQGAFSEKAPLVGSVPQESVKDWQTHFSFLGQKAFFVGTPSFQIWEKKNLSGKKDLFPRLLAFHQKNFEQHLAAFQDQSFPLADLEHALWDLCAVNCSLFRVEAYDIATFQGEGTVGSQVVFQEGQPVLSQYRRYQIREVEAQRSDMASLCEVLERRWNQKSFPNFLLLDGGEPQLREILKKLPQWFEVKGIQIMGLAKNRSYQKGERLVFLRKNQWCVAPLEPGSLLYRFFTQVRNEAHRFANQFHRRVRDRKSLTDPFHLSAQQKKKLLEVCGQIHRVSDFSVEELIAKTGLSKRLLLSLQVHFSKNVLK